MTRRTRRRAATVVVASAALLVAASCTGSDISGGDTKGPSSTASSTQGLTHNAADVEFVLVVIRQDQLAVELADDASAQSEDPEITALAEQVRAHHLTRIDRLAQLRDTWGIAEGTSVEDVAGATTIDEQINEPDGTTSADRDRAFLENLILHHERSIELAQRELTEGRDDATLEVAQRVLDEHQAEVEQTQAMLGEDR